MNIGPSLMSILPSSYQKGSERNDGRLGQDSKRGDGFGQIYDQTGAGSDGSDAYTPGERAEQRHLSAVRALDAGVTFESAELKYSLDFSIGERAVSFHARPIVGPASVDPLANLAIDAPAAELSTRAEPAHIRIDNSRETNLGAAHLAAMVPTASDTDSVSKIAPSVATKAAPTGHTPPHGPSRTGTQQAPSQATQNLPNARAHSAPEQSGKTTHTSQPQSQLQARAQLFANILASAKDYRVATRGIQLSDSEIDRLATDIRAALRGLGLADLPVIVSGTSGEK